MFLKTGHFVSGCVDETGSRQINMKPDYPVEIWAVGNTKFILVQGLQDYETPPPSELSRSALATMSLKSAIHP